MSKKRVLVADDEVHILNVVSFKLRNAGLEVITARDGTEAFELAKSEVPDLMVVDYQMPGMNGLELCLALREEPGTTHIPAVMLTARGLDIEQPELDRAGIEKLQSNARAGRITLRDLTRTDSSGPAGPATGSGAQARRLTSKSNEGKYLLMLVFEE